MASEAGKGSASRPIFISKEQFDKNFEQIFGKKNQKNESKEVNKTQETDKSFDCNAH